jgi:uncharacterized protein
VSPKPRFVFDNNVLVSALLFEHSVPGQAFYAALNAGVILLSAATFVELSAVLCRPKFDRYVTPEERERFLAMLLAQSALIEVSDHLQECRDPKDDKFLELALSGGAACLVSGDRDLLALNPFRGVPILTPSDFVAWLDRSRNS